jgi:hypothetical protein
VSANSFVRFLADAQGDTAAAYTTDRIYGVRKPFSAYLAHHLEDRDEGRRVVQCETCGKACVWLGPIDQFRAGWRRVGLSWFCKEHRPEDV